MQVTCKFNFGCARKLLRAGVFLPGRICNKVANQRNHRPVMLSVWLLCLFLLGQLVDAVHLAQIQHGLCPDDGELIHTAERHFRSQGTQSASVLGPAPLLKAGCGCLENHQHAHCVSAAHRQARWLQPPDLHQTTWGGPCADSRFFAYQADHSLRSRRIFRLAPKHSPPQ